MNASAALWEKYTVGEHWGIKDPATGKPSVRNIFVDGPVAGPATVGALQGRVVVFWQCNFALGSARRYELAANGLNFNHYYLGGLHSAYVRGSALRALGRYPEAAVEFQKMLDHRGLVGLDPIGALAQLQLGRMLAASGDRTGAKAAYEVFLALWKDADPDITVLREARAEYAQL